MGFRTKALLSSLFIIIVVFIAKTFHRGDQILNTRKSHQQDGMKIKLDHYCLNTIQDIIDKDGEGNLVIPTYDVLSVLPLNVLDCLYHRYTSSLQTYCSVQDKHGSCSKGWNLCVDGCYNPTNDTVIHVLSGRVTDNDRAIHSVMSAYDSRVLKYAPIAIGEVIAFQQVESKWASYQSKHQNFTLIDEFHHSKEASDVLIIDVGDMTKQTINYILEKGLLEHFKQISFRTQYIDSTKYRIDYISALYHLSTFYKYGFRIYWYEMEWECILKGNIYRTSCVTVNWIQKTCENKADLKMNRHLIIPDDVSLSHYSLEQEAIFYQRYLTSIQNHCKETVRLGGITDGGWEVCNDAKYRPRQSCLVYSFGINWDFKFDDAIVAAYGCEVHSFDPSMNKNDFQHARHVSFHNLGLLDENVRDVKTGWMLSTLKSIRENLGHLYRKLDIIKIDIENSEWKAIPEMIQSGALRDVSQLYIEFHSVGTKLHLKILRLLYDEGFRIFWYHRNPSCCLKDKLIEYSLCNEVYFVRE